MTRALPSTFLVALVSFLVISTAGVRPEQAQPAADRVEVSDVMVPMRDGKRLFTKIFTPRGSKEPLPIIFKRTPYGIDGSAGNFNSYFSALADEGYIFVFQDIRGRFTSEGEFVMLRNPRKKGDTKAIDEGTDTYDTIEWLLKNVERNNGRVGMLGVSYPGWLTVMAIIEPHPALKAVSPQASPASMFLGDDFHHNGAFRLSYGFEYAAMMEGGREVSRFQFDQHDTYSWYLSLGPLTNANALHLKNTRPTWNNFVEHPDFDAFWQREAVMQYLDAVRVPTLNVGGWWDQEDFYGPLKIYETLEKHDTKNQNYLVVGPWNHGGWRSASGQRLGNIDFGSNTSPHYKKTIEAPWFAYWLKDKGTLNLPEATTFEAGANAWRSYDAWPPKPTVSSPRKLYFAANGKMSYDAPTDTSRNAYDGYISDPNKPVPYRQRPIVASLGGAGSTWSVWLADDQRFVQDRPDVVAWESPVLTEDVTIAGEIFAQLFAATSGSDADWVVKLIDVYPENDARIPGYQFMVANDVFRGRYRKSFEKPEALTPNRTEEFKISLHTQNYRFLKGHKIRVQVQSSWFPLIDRNPQTFVPNIFKAKESDFRATTQRVYRSKQAASYISLPIVRTQIVP